MVDIFLVWVNKKGISEFFSQERSLEPPEKELQNKMLDYDKACYPQLVLL